MTTTAGRTPEETEELIAEFMERKDVDGALDLVEPDAVLVDPSSGQQMRGHGEIRRALAASTSMDARSLPGPPPTGLMTGDVALVLVRWTLETEDESGQPVRQSGQATDVLRRQGDGMWRSGIDDPAGVELPGTWSVTGSAQESSTLAPGSGEPVCLRVSVPVAAGGQHQQPQGRYYPPARAGL